MKVVFNHQQYVSFPFCC